MPRVICPFCLKTHDFSVANVCTEYTESVPAVYIREYGKVPPLWLVTVGFSKHGKTTYLAALTLMLEHISPIWHNVYYRPLDTFTHQKIQEIHVEAETGKMPGSTTRQEVSRPLLFSVYNLPESGSRCLVMYDVAGEIFDSIENVQNYVPSIRQVNTTWFLISLDDLLKDKEGRTVTDLFNAYLSAMESLRSDLKDRNLIVVFTKGDSLTIPGMRSYLMSDPLQGLTVPGATASIPQGFSMPEYLDRMRVISDQLEEYTRYNVRGGSAFINMVRASGMNLVFSITSALGENPTGDQRLNVHANRYRVLDPFLWAITLEKPISSRPLYLIVDGSSTSQKIYEQKLNTSLSDILAEHGNVTVFYLGQSRPASQPGQQTPAIPPRIFKQRLVGPILDEISPSARVMLVAAGRVLDLDDFYETIWRDRLLLVTMDEDRNQLWPNSLVYRDGDDPVIFVDRLLNIE